MPSPPLPALKWGLGRGESQLHPFRSLRGTACSWAPLGWPCLPTRCSVTASGRDLEFLLQDCSWRFLREPLEPWRWQITAGRSSQNGQQQLLWVQVYRYDAVCQEHWPPKKHWKQRFFFCTCKHCMQCQRIYFKDKAVTLSEVVSTIAFMVVFFFP